MASLFSVPAGQFSVPTTNHLNNGDQGTTRMGGQQQQPGTSRNVNEDWSTKTITRQQRKWGPFGGDISISEGQRGKRKASYDAPEKTRKKQKNYLEASQCEQFAASSTTTSDARCVGFGSPHEVTQSEVDDRAYMVPVHQLPHFHSDSLTGFPEQLDQAMTQQEFFEHYQISQERHANMFNISTWGPRHNLDYGLIAQHGHGESFSLHEDQHDLCFQNVTPRLEYPAERLAHKYPYFNLLSDLESQRWTVSSEC